MDIAKDDKIAGLLAKKLSGELQPDEQDMLTEWAESSPANKSLYEEITDAGFLHAYKNDASGVNKAEELSAIHRKVRGKRIRRIGSWSAAAAVIAAGVFFLWPSKLSDSKPGEIQQAGNHMAIITVGEAAPVYLSGEENVSAWRDAAEKATMKTVVADEYRVKIEVPRGSEYKVRLDDGTMVWLNSESSIEYPKEFIGDKRNVKLTGEAFFEVAKDTGRPFAVEVEDMLITVLGTSFNINAYNKESYFTTLLSGCVLVADRNGSQAIELRPNQQASFAEGRIDVKEVDAEMYASWTKGKFYFRATPMEDIAAQLERWYDVEFEFTREEYRHEPFTGVISRSDTAGKTLDLIEKTTNLRFEINNRTIRVK
ncbi:DUF4974 domain-containing protein [Alistipes sp. OttesenSCG-928-B03]|nr:DUF4974 domain-containing protein [Alistipes sp. OttesenSCG-928-B03]